MKITRTSMFSGKANTFDLPVTKAQLQAWQAGGMVQDVFPNLSPEQREFLISGATPDEWKQMFRDEDEEAA